MVVTSDFKNERNLIKDLLIIFYKNPEPGKVKRRLAASIGNEAACKLYQEMAGRTLSATKNLTCDSVVFYSSRIEITDLWSPDKFGKMVQSGKDLGERMQHAFKWAFNKGYSRIVLLGTDIYYIERSHIDSAFEYLDQRDLVIGPAFDGGYYLIGLNRFYPSLFQDKHWSSSLVFDETVADCTKLGLTHACLPKLLDVDRAEDLNLLDPEDRYRIFENLGINKGAG